MARELSQIRARLLELRDRDLALRQRLVAEGALFDGYHPAMEALHLANAGELLAIIEALGGSWPGRSQIGEEAAEAAWLIAQHAISAPDVQRRCERLLAEAVERGEAEPRHHAYLVDRICFHERRPQRYGTSFDWDEHGALSPWVIEEPESVDARRAAVGLPRLEAAVAEIRAQAEAEGETPPQSFGERQAQMADWARRTGWLMAGD